MQTYSYHADPDAPILMVGAREVGLRAAELLHTRRFFGHTIEELFGDRLSFHEVIRVIAEGLEFPNLNYIQINDIEAIRNLRERGLSEALADAYVELAEGLSRGLITVTRLNPTKPNATMRYKKFVVQEFIPAYRKVA